MHTYDITSLLTLYITPTWFNTYKVIFREYNFTTAESFYWTTLLVYINYTLWKSPFNSWTMLELRIVLLKLWFNNIWVHLLVFIEEILFEPIPRPRGLRHGSGVSRLLGLQVRILLGASVSVSCECHVLSGRGFCVGLIFRSEKTYSVWCVWVWWWSLDNEEALAH